MLFVKGASKFGVRFCRHITTEKFYIEPTDEVINELLVIDRVSQEILLQSMFILHL